MQYWSFETRDPQTPKTLADCPEGVPVVVDWGSAVIRIRSGSHAYESRKDLQTVALRRDPAGHYAFIRYLDPPPVVLPATLGVGEPYRLYSVAGYSGLWWKDAAGTSWNIGIDGISSTTSGLPTSSRVLSATNIFAVLKTLD